MATTYNWISAESGFYIVMNAAGDAIFYFLPFLLAFTAAKKLKADVPMALVLAGLLVGGTRQFLVFAGMHFSMSPIMMNNFATLGYDMIAPVNCVATMAVAGMSFGAFLRAKQTDNKASSGSAFISAFIGITEPALYGVGFRFKRPLIGAIIGGAVSGAFVAASGAKAITYAMPAIISLPAYTGSIPTMLIGLLISFVVSAVVTFLLGMDENIEKDDRAIQAEKKNILK